MRTKVMNGIVAAMMFAVAGGAAWAQEASSKPGKRGKILSTVDALKHTRRLSVEEASAVRGEGSKNVNYGVKGTASFAGTSVSASIGRNGVSLEGSVGVGAKVTKGVSKDWSGNKSSYTCGGIEGGGGAFYYGSGGVRGCTDNKGQRYNTVNGAVGVGAGFDGGAHAAVTVFVSYKYRPRK